MKIKPKQITTFLMLAFLACIIILSAGCTITGSIGIETPYGTIGGSASHEIKDKPQTGFAK